jgi:hypothetical protein
MVQGTTTSPPTLRPGLLICSKDKKPLKWIPIEDTSELQKEYTLDEEAWSEEVQRAFDEAMKWEINFEKAIMEATQNPDAASKDITIPVRAEIRAGTSVKEKREQKIQLKAVDAPALVRPAGNPIQPSVQTGLEPKKSAETAAILTAAVGAVLNTQVPSPTAQSPPKPVVPPMPENSPQNVPAAGTDYQKITLQELEPLLMTAPTLVLDDGSLDLPKGSTAGKKSTVKPMVKKSSAPIPTIKQLPAEFSAKTPKSEEGGWGETNAEPELESIFKTTPQSESPKAVSTPESKEIQTSLAETPPTTREVFSTGSATGSPLPQTLLQRPKIREIKPVSDSQIPEKQMVPAQISDSVPTTIQSPIPSTPQDKETTVAPSTSDSAPGTPEKSSIIPTPIESSVRPPPLPLTPEMQETGKTDAILAGKLDEPLFPVPAFDPPNSVPTPAPPEIKTDPEVKIEISTQAEPTVQNTAQSEAAIENSAAAMETASTIDSVRSAETSTINESAAIPTAAAEVVAIPIPKVRPVIPTPFADEFWEAYYGQKQFLDAHRYIGNGGSIAKIRGLVEEVNQTILNPSMCDISRPIVEDLNSGLVYFIGDTHGSVDDTDRCIRYFVPLIEEAKKSDKPVRVIFLGDYVDRHSLDIHNLLYVLAFAVKYPEYVRLLRGNHEEVTINANYGFRRNMESEFEDPELFIEIEELFANLPLMHVIQTPHGSIMGLHGGIPLIETDFGQLPEIPDLMHGEGKIDSCYLYINEMDTLAQQILWNDPAVDLPPNMLYLPSPRGIGYHFGEQVFNAWSQKNGIDRVVRGHEVFLSGHQEFFDDRVFSIFSSSNYAGRRIKARILEFDLDKEWASNWRHYEIQKELNR